MCVGRRRGDRAGESALRLGADPCIEHRSCPLCDPAVELLLRDVEPEDERRVARVVGPEAIALACLSRELEAADDAPTVVRVDGCGRLGIELGESAVRAFGAFLVVELFQALALARLRCGWKRQV